LQNIVETKYSFIKFSEQNNQSYSVNKQLQNSQYTELNLSHLYVKIMGSISLSPSHSTSLSHSDVPMRNVWKYEVDCG